MAPGIRIQQLDWWYDGDETSLEFLSGDAGPLSIKEIQNFLTINQEHLITGTA